jgi:hypothetical protein
MSDLIYGIFIFLFVFYFLIPLLIEFWHIANEEIDDDQ